MNGFQNNYMKLNEDKCHSFIAGNKYESTWQKKIGETKIWESNKQRLLRVQIDKKLSFDEHVSNLCKKNGRKLFVFARLSGYMSLKQRKY